MRSTLKKLLTRQIPGEGGKEKTPEEGAAKETPKEDEKEDLELKPVEVPKSSVKIEELMAHFVTLVEKTRSLVAFSQRAIVLSENLGEIRVGIERYMADVQHYISEKETERAEFVEKEKALKAKCKETERECKILRGDDELLNSLSPEEVTKYVDFVMEAVGQVAVAKYLTHKSE